jgi:16S rRNA (guanine527-N7)-methyltransferase
MSEQDDLGTDARVVEYLGDAYPAIARFAEMLQSEGVLRGLIGPREVEILWERHLLNSAAVAQVLPPTGRLVDVGSGAGLPGIVLAAMLPDVDVVLVEPMERRTDWLAEVVAELGLQNVTVRRARAEDVHGDLIADVVTARAVAPLDRLCGWTLPLLAQGGELVAMKGRQAGAEIAAATKVIRRFGGGPARIVSVGTIPGVDATTIVRIVRETVRGAARR